MTLLAVLIIAVGVFVMVRVHRRAIGQLEQRVEGIPARLEQIAERIEQIQEQLAARQHTLVKQSKLSIHNAERTRRATEKLADRARHLLDESQRLQHGVESSLADPNLQKVLRRERN